MFKNKAILIIASAMLAMPALVQAQGVTPTAGGKGGTVSADQLITRYSTLAGGTANAKSLVNGLRTGSDITLATEEKVCTASQTTCNAFEQTCAAYAQTCTTTTKCVQQQLCLPGQPGCVGGFICTKTESSTTCVDDTSKCTKLVDTNVCKPGQSVTSCKTWGTQSTNLQFSPGAAAPMGFGNVDIALALTEARLGANTTPTAAALKAALLEILGKRAAGDGWGKIAKSYGFQLQE